MTSSVTVVGAHDQTLTLSMDASANLVLARQLANWINQGVQAGAIRPATDADGPPPPVHGNGSGEYVLTRSGFAILPQHYRVAVVTARNSVLIGSGERDEMILSDSRTNLTFIAAGGSGTVVAGGGDNRLLIPMFGHGDWSLNTGGGNDVILALGRGNDTIQAGAGRNAIQLGAGRDVIVSAGDDTIVAGGGAATIDATGAAATLVHGNGSDLLFIGGSGGATIYGGHGSDTYLGGVSGPAGSQLVQGGSDGHNYLFAGDGAATLFGGGRGDQLFAYGTSDQWLQASDGNTTLSGAFGSGDNRFVGGRGNDLIIGGTGADTFVGGGGRDTVVAAGGGHDVFQFINDRHHGGGTELVRGIFDPADVHITLTGYAPNEAARALAGQKSAAGSVTISLSDGTRVTFENITHLDSRNFS